VLYARQWCSDPDDAVQEAFLDFTKLETLPDETLAWLYTTVRRKAQNQHRSARRREHYHRRAWDVHSGWFVRHEVTAIEAEEVAKALECLAPVDREIVVAKIWGNLTFDQIARIVDRPPSTVYRSYRTAIGQLTELLDSEKVERKPTK
jgi:RNA polymerase sigma-70 factor (ECF subfamily)